MKQLLLSVIFLFSTSAFTCQNFTGTYLSPANADGAQTEVRIVQNGCESVAMDLDSLSVDLPADGQMQQIETLDLYFGDQIIGTLSLNASVELTDLELLFYIYIEMDVAGESSVDEVGYVMTLLPNGDIQVVVTLQDGQTSNYVLTRVKKN